MKPLHYILIIAAMAIGFVWLLRKPAKTYEMGRRDEYIRSLESGRIKDSLFADLQLKAKDAVIKSLQDKDTVFVRQLVTNDKKIKASNDRVDAIADSELERVITAAYQ